jgi:hypothetical protein
MTKPTPDELAAFLIDRFGFIAMGCKPADDLDGLFTGVSRMNSAKCPTCGIHTLSPWETKL